MEEERPKRNPDGDAVAEAIRVATECRGCMHKQDSKRCKCEEDEDGRCRNYRGR